MDQGKSVGSNNSSKLQNRNLNQSFNNSTFNTLLNEKGLMSGNGKKTQEELHSAKKIKDMEEWGMRHSISFEQKCPNLGWTNAVLFRPFNQEPKQINFYLPAYLVMKIKNFKSFKVEEMNSQANVVLILDIYFGNLPVQLIEEFTKKLQIQFSMNDTISTKEGQSGNVQTKINYDTRTVKFTIRTSLIFQLQPRQIFNTKNNRNSLRLSGKNEILNQSKGAQLFSNSLWLSPFQLLNQTVFLTLNKATIKLKDLYDKYKNNQENKSGEQVIQGNQKKKQDVKFNKQELIKCLKKFKLHDNGIKSQKNESNSKNSQYSYQKLENIVFMVNLMDYDDQHFKINMNNPNHSILGHYSLAQNLVSTRYLHAKGQDPQRTLTFYLEMLILKKNRLKFDLQEQQKQLEDKIKKKNLMNSISKQIMLQSDLQTVKGRRLNIEKLIQGMKLRLQIRKIRMKTLSKINSLELKEKQRKIIKKNLEEKRQKNYSSYYRAGKTLQEINSVIEQLEREISNLFDNEKKINQKLQLLIKQKQSNTNSRNDFQEALQQYRKDTQLQGKYLKKYELNKEIFSQKGHKKYEKKVDVQFQEFKNLFFPLPPDNDKTQKKQIKKQKQSFQTKIDVINKLFENKDTNNKFQRLYFQYANFNAPVFKNPGVSLATIFVPLTILTLISLFIYLQNFDDFGSRLANIATLMIAYTAYFQVIRDQIPKFQYIVLIQILIYLQIGSNILCLIQSYTENRNITHPNQNHNADITAITRLLLTNASYHFMRQMNHYLGSASQNPNNQQCKNEEKSLTFPQAGVFFQISAYLLLAITVGIILAYCYHLLVCRPSYTKGENFINLCQKKEITQFTKWYNTQADVYFMHQESRLIPLEIHCRQDPIKNGLFVQ